MMINVLMAALHLHKLKCIVFRLMSLQLLIASEPCKGQYLTPILRVRWMHNNTSLGSNQGMTQFS